MAIFPQRAAVRLSALEPDLGGAGRDRDALVYYNKVCEPLRVPFFPPSKFAELDAHPG